MIHPTHPHWYKLNKGGLGPMQVTEVKSDFVFVV